MTYAYDASNIANCPTPVIFGTGPDGLSNPIGHRTAMCFNGGSESWSYDPMGRIAAENDGFIWLQTPYSPDVVTYNGAPYLSENTQYHYYLNGDLLEVFYPNPDGATDYEFSTSENAAGQVTTAGDKYYTVLSQATYTPTGQLANAMIGWSETYNGSKISNTYNNRLQPVLESASTYSGTPILNLTYNFNLGNGTTGSDNGNVIQIANGKDSNRTQNFLYDPFNRIWQAYTNGTNWGETYSPNPSAPGIAYSASNAGIDAWGNLTNRSPVTGKTNSESLACAPANTQNQLNTCFTYDAAGNVIKNGAITYTYDAENRLIATAGTSYVYDGEGNRVQKCTQGATAGTCASSSTGMLYWLHAGGGTLAESDLGGNWTAVYGLIRGLIASRVDLPANVVHYYFHDHLNTTNIVTDAVGTILKEDDFYPYGGEISVSGSDSNRYKFTGKERDAESNLDNFGARYYGSSMGRFMTPDWAAKPAAVPYANFGNPQSLNLYSYVENNPTTLGDPDGHMFWAPALSGVNVGDISFAIASAAGQSELGHGLTYFGTLADEAEAAQQAASQSSQAQNNGQAQSQPATSSDKPWDFRQNVVDLLRANNGCSDWFNTGTGSAADIMSNVPITLGKPPKGPIPGPDAETSASPKSPIEVNPKGRFYSNSDNQLPVGDKYKPGSNGARTVILLHELAHKTGLIPSDNFSTFQSERNTKTVIEHCSDAIGP